jgi:hypothetical protein
MMRTLGVLWVAGVIVLAAMAACTNALDPAGATCTADRDCAAGLSCLVLASRTDASCTTLAKTCSKACLSDNDCAAVGTNYKCIATCGAMGSCGQTQ